MLDKFHEIAEKVSTYFGEKVEWATSAKAPSANEVDDLFGQYPLHSLFPYEAYDEENKIFINKKSIGFILEASVLTGSTEETENILTSIITDIVPHNSDLQFLYWGSDKIAPILDDFQKERSGKGEIFEWLAEQRTAFLKKGTLNSLSTTGSLILRDFKLYIIFSKPKKNVNTQIEELVELRNEMVSSLKSIQIHTRDIPIENFLSTLSDLINPSSNPHPTHQPWRHLDPLNQQITDPEHQLQVYPNRLIFGSENENVDVRCFTVKNFPKQMSQWKTSENIGQLFNSTLQVPCPFLISLSLRVQDHEKSIAKSQMKYMDKDSTAKSPLAKFKPNISKEHKDWEYVRGRLADGDRLVKALYQVVAYARPKEANMVERKIRDLYQANGWRLRKERFVQMPAWLSVFPMMMTEGFYQDFKVFGRLRTMTAFNAITIAPLQGEWKGTKTPSLLLPGRRGQLAVWNPFDNPEGNFNVAIAAKSGSGKSVFTQEYIVSILGSGGRVWVIDVGRSYEKTCRMLGGEFMEFRTETPISINPFTHIKNFDDSLELLKPLLAMMARPTGNVSDEELSYLEKALKETWRDHGNKSNISTVSKWLDSQSNITCKTLSHLLYSYTKEGMYGKFFEDPCSLKMDNPFIVLELEELKSKKDLQKIVLFVLMYQISEQMYLGNRHQIKSCIIDEAWDLMDGESKTAEKFIETGYRRSRRYRGNFVSITQGINDYYRSAASLAAYQNSDYSVILAQKPESLEQLKDLKQLSMDPFTEKLLKSVKKTDEYSEFVIKGPQGTSVHRLILDSFSRILFSSKGEEFEAVKKLQEKGLSLKDAITTVARKFAHV